MWGPGYIEKRLGPGTKGFREKKKFGISPEIKTGSEMEKKLKEEKEMKPIQLTGPKKSMKLKKKLVIRPREKTEPAKGPVKTVKKSTRLEYTPLELRVARARRQESEVKRMTSYNKKIKIEQKSKNKKTHMVASYVARQMAQNVANALSEELPGERDLTFKGLAQIPLSTIKRTKFNEISTPLKMLVCVPGLLDFLQQLIKILR